MEVGTYVEIISMNLYGRVASIHTDDRNEPIFTIELDNATDTPDGRFLTRRWEIRES